MRAGEVSPEVSARSWRSKWRSFLVSEQRFFGKTHSTGQQSTIPTRFCAHIRDVTLWTGTVCLAVLASRWHPMPRAPDLPGGWWGVHIRWRRRAAAGRTDAPLRLRSRGLSGSDERSLAVFRPGEERSERSGLLGRRSKPRTSWMRASLGLLYLLPVQRRTSWAGRSARSRSTSRVQPSSGM